MESGVRSVCFRGDFTIKSVDESCIGVGVRLKEAAYAEEFSFIGTILVSD